MPKPSIQARARIRVISSLILQAIHNGSRLLLASLAYTLIEAIRRLALKGTEMTKAQCGTIRLKLLKIGAVIIRNTRRVRFLLSSAYPYQHLFKHAAEQLDSS